MIGDLLDQYFYSAIFGTFLGMAGLPSSNESQPAAPIRIPEQLIDSYLREISELETQRYELLEELRLLSAENAALAKVNDYLQVLCEQSSLKASPKNVSLNSLVPRGQNDIAN